MKPSMLLTPRVMAMESALLAANKELPKGQYRAWIASEWLSLSLDEASELLWPRLKRSERIINEDCHADYVRWQNITAKAWYVWNDKPGVHVLLEVV